MLITTDWYLRPVIYDNEKYIYESTPDNLKILDKKTHTTIFECVYPVLVKQISDNEFIVVDKSPKGLDYYFILQHLKYNEENQTTTIIYQKEYKSKSIIGKIKTIDDLLIMESYLDISIYNPQTRKFLTLEDSIIIEDQNNLKTDYLIARTNIEDQDYLTMYINKDTLESDYLYSRLQDRAIPIVKTDNNDFKSNYNNTIQQEVIKYIELLAQIEESYNQQSDSKAIQILRKKLTEKKPSSK